MKKSREGGRAIAGCFRNEADIKSWNKTLLDKTKGLKQTQHSRWSISDSSF
jgi:hypothetical protein